LLAPLNHVFSAHGRNREQKFVSVESIEQPGNEDSEYVLKMLWDVDEQNGKAKRPGSS
jgi:hypothetical protein